MMDFVTDGICNEYPYAITVIYKKGISSLWRSDWRQSTPWVSSRWHPLHYSAPLTRAYCQLSLLTDATLFLLVCVSMCVRDCVNNRVIVRWSTQQSVNETSENTYERETPLSLPDLLITNFLFTFWGLKF